MSVQNPIKMSKNDPVLEYCHNIPIRKSNIFQIRLTATVYKALILESERTGLPISKIIIYGSRPCERCVKEDALVFIDGEPVRVKKGILSLWDTQLSGRSIIKQADAKK